MSIKIRTNETTVKLAAPFHPEMPRKARALGGKFDSVSKEWVFDARDEDRVRKLAVEIYGTDGTDVDDTVTVRITVAEGRTWASEKRQSLYLGGQQIARAYGRDSGAKLADGVVLLEGSVRSGGSAKNWHTCTSEGTILEVRDVPRGVAHKMIAEAENDHSPDIASAEIVGANEGNRREVLRAERERLVARIAEIDAELQR